jgi:hypothetical protein
MLQLVCVESKSRQLRTIYIISSGEFIRSAGDRSERCSEFRLRGGVPSTLRSGDRVAAAGVDLSLSGNLVAPLRLDTLLSDTNLEDHETVMKSWDAEEQPAQSLGSAKKC